MFSINEDIDFTDEDINLSILNLPKKSVEPAAKSLPNPATQTDVKQQQAKNKHNYREEKKGVTSNPTKRFKFTKTNQEAKTTSKKLDPTPDKNSKFHNSIDIPDDLFDFDDEDDDLFSQLDLLKNNVSVNKNESGKKINKETTTPNINSKTPRHDGNQQNQCNDITSKSKQSISRKIYPTATTTALTPLPVKTPSAKCSEKLPCPKISTPNVSKISNNVFHLRSVRKSKQSPGIRGETPSRKFPGPAGNLPKINNLKELDSLRSPPSSKSNKSAESPITPKTPLQETVNNCEDQSVNLQLWTAMHEFVEQKFAIESLLTLSEVLEKSRKRELENCKVPLLCGIVKSFTIVGSSGRLVLEDETSEINGAVHHDVLDQYQQGLGKGTGLILKDVSVFSPSVKKHYLNITPANIAALFERDLEEPLTQFTQTVNNSTILLDDS